MKIARRGQFIIVRGTADEKMKFAGLGEWVEEVNKLLKDREKILSITPVSYQFDQGMDTHAGEPFVWTHKQIASVLLLLIG